MNTAPVLTMIRVTGPDYDRAVAAAEDGGSSVTAVVAHLREIAGDRIEGRTTLKQLMAEGHPLHHVIWAHVHHWLQINHQQGLYVLHRTPTIPEDEKTA